MKKTKKRPHLILGRNIASRRESLGFTQEDLAYKAGIGISGLKDIERGVAEGYPETRLAVAKVLGCTLADLYIDQSIKGIPDFTWAADFLSKFRGLSARRKKFVLALVFDDEAYFSDEPSLEEAHQALIAADGK